MLALAALLLLGAVAAEASRGWTWPAPALARCWRSRFGAAKSDDCSTAFNVRAKKTPRRAHACCD